MQRYIKYLRFPNIFCFIFQFPLIFLQISTIFAIFAPKTVEKYGEFTITEREANL